jgi:hypothetical protein
VDRRRLLRLLGLGVVAVLIVLAVSRVTSSPVSDGGPAATGPANGEAAATAAAEPSSPMERGAEYPRTREGAVAAATAYALALDNPDILDAGYRLAVLEEIAAEATRAELVTAFDEGLGLIGSQLHLDAEVASDPGFVWRAVPGGWQVSDYDRTSASVGVWTAVMAIADGRLLVQPSWRTTEVTLVWERGGWRLVGFHTGPGPDPMLVSADAGAVARQINAFEPYRHWPDTAADEVGP